MMKRVSIKDIAKQAGVVPSTVSLVLNGKAKQMRISDEMATRIRALAKKSGYQPNQTAVSLRTGRSNILGLIVEDISNVFFASLAKSIEDGANALGFKIVYCSTDNNDEKGNELIQVLLQRQVDGFIITPSAGMMHSIVKLLDLNIPCVLMDRYFPGIDAPYVLVDNKMGSRIAVEHLFENGYRNIAFITSALDQVQMQDRLSGFQDTLDDLGLPQHPSQLLRIPYGTLPEEAVALIVTFLQDTPAIDAVFFSTNYLGVYGIEAVYHLNLSIPRDLGIICFDDNDLFRITPPGITCIRQPKQEIADSALRLLLQQIDNSQSNGASMHEMRSPELIVRGSTSKY